MIFKIILNIITIKTLIAFLANGLLMIGVSEFW